MPYIITTRTTVPGWEEDGAVATRSRRAVATLDEARDDGSQIADDHLQPRYAGAYRGAFNDLPADGGTVGPLPDGTMIEVTPVAWNWVIGVADDMGIDTDAVYEDGGDAAIMAAYNAQVTA